MVTYEELALAVDDLKNLPIDISTSELVDDDEIALYLYLCERYKNGELTSKRLVLSSNRKKEGLTDHNWGGLATKYTLISYL